MSLPRGTYGYGALLLVVVAAAGTLAFLSVRNAYAETGTCTTTTSSGYWAAWSGPNCNIIDPNTNLYTCGAVTGAMWIPPTTTTYCTQSYCGLPSSTTPVPVTTCWIDWWGWVNCTTTYYTATTWYNCTGTTCEKCTSTPYAYCNYDVWGYYFCESQPRYNVSCSPTTASPISCAPTSLTCPDGYVAQCAPSCNSSGSGCGTCTPSCTGHTCAANTGQTCYSATNACGYKSASQILCNGSCPALTPVNPAGYGTACTACNNVGQCSTGTTQCNGTCSVTAPPNLYTDYCSEYKLVDYGLDCVKGTTTNLNAALRYVGGECGVAPFNVVGGCQKFSPGTNASIAGDLVVPTPMTATGNIRIQAGGLLRLKAGGSLKLCPGCTITTSDGSNSGIVMEGGELITE